MQGPIKMYTLRPVVARDINVQLPTCMYRLKNIHAGICRNGTANDTLRLGGQTASNVESIAEQVNQFLKKNQGTQNMDQVLQRQEVVMKKLEDLQNQIATIRNKLRSTDCSTENPVQMASEESTKNQINLGNLPGDLTLNANPNNPPYSLVLLRNYWRNHCYCYIKVVTYTHSGIAKLSEAATAFEEILRRSENEQPTLPVITLRLIWREIGINQFELSGNRPIQGEVNFLRYLARLTNSLKYDETNFEIDTLLDVCYTLTRSSTKIEKLALLQRLGKKLGKNPFILGDFSLVDIAAYSAIKQNVPDGVNVTLTKWMKNCEAL